MRYRSYVFSAETSTERNGVRGVMQVWGCYGCKT